MTCSHPALAREPGNSDINLAVGRLYSGADEPQKALAVNQAVLDRDPGNLEARKAAVNAAIQAANWTSRGWAGTRRHRRSARRSANVAHIGYTQSRPRERKACLRRLEARTGVAATGDRGRAVSRRSSISLRADVSRRTSPDRAMAYTALEGFDNPFRRGRAPSCGRKFDR